MWPYISSIGVTEANGPMLIASYDLYPFPHMLVRPTNLMSQTSNSETGSDLLRRTNTPLVYST